MPAYKYQTKDGKTRWYVSFHYIDWMGQNKRKKKMGFATRKEAVEYERFFLDSEKKNPDVTFAALIDAYMKDCGPRMKPSTLAHKKYTYDTKIIPYFGKMKISEITPARIRSWQSEMINYRNEKGQPFSGTYLKSIHTELSAAMNFAVKYYGLSKNPCHSSGSMGKSKAGEMSIWTRDQFERFILLEKKKVFHLAFNILFYSGIREGELLALTPNDIDRENAVIHINKTYAVIDGQEFFLTPKTDRSKRDVTIHEELHQELLSYIDIIQADKNERIFYFTKYGLIYELHKIGDKAGLPRIRVHDLRHSHASMLIEMGIPIIQISERLGHENIQVTLKTYAHLYPGKERDIPDQIRVLFQKDADLKNLDTVDTENDI